jgi:predicted HTH domain antitoxin
MKNNVLIFLIFVFSAGLFCFAKQEETLQQLIARADAASAGQQADLCMEVAEREVKLAVAAYKDNKIDEGRDSLQQIVKYADKGHSAAMQSGKRLKHTEIKLRQIALHVRDLKSNVDVDDQPLAQAAVDKLEDFRTEILKSMFGSKHND